MDAGFTSEEGTDLTRIRTDLTIMIMESCLTSKDTDMTTEDSIDQCIYVFH